MGAEGAATSTSTPLPPDAGKGRVVTPHAPPVLSLIEGGTTASSISISLSLSVVGVAASPPLRAQPPLDLRDTHATRPRRATAAMPSCTPTDAMKLPAESSSPASGAALGSGGACSSTAAVGGATRASVGAGDGATR